MSKTLIAAAAALASALGPGAALACDAGAEACPIPVEMKPGTDTITLVHELKQNVECCYYSLAARAGQTLTWSFQGPDARSLITYPDGSSDGPGIPNSIPLKATGTYILGFTPDLMADNAYGPFRATVTIK
ncbi:MAG: hypothetical protein KDK07_06090 [Bauldia sp.]|nr:hypothetical protein [Bauldia sp.]